MTYSTTKTIKSALPTVDTSITLDSDSEGAIAYPYPVTEWYLEVDYTYNGETLTFKVMLDDSEVVGGNPYAVTKTKLIERLPSVWDEVFAVWYDDSEIETARELDSDSSPDSESFDYTLLS